MFCFAIVKAKLHMNKHYNVRGVCEEQNVLQSIVFINYMLINIA